MLTSVYLTMTFKLPEEEQDAEAFERSESKYEWTRLKSSSAITYEFRTTRFVPTSGMPFETE